MWFRRTDLPTARVPASLIWRGDDLVDWIGGAAWHLDGSMRPLSSSTTWRNAIRGADAVIADASGRFALVHERAGTEGAMLRDGELVRVVKRGDDNADAYDYPACFFRARDRLLFAHCPERYDRVEIDDVDTGERVSASAAREPVDFFYSRLLVSPNARRMLTAGWVWHPWDAVQWLDVDKALDDPTGLDRWQSAAASRSVALLAEESSATFLGDDLVVIGGSGEEEDEETRADFDREHPGEKSLHPSGVAVVDAATGACISSWRLGYPPGVMMAAGMNHVVTFFEHPRLVSLDTGDVVHEWLDLDSGDIVSSITRGRARPALALDSARVRFALATPDAIVVVTLDAADLPHTALEADERARR